MKPIFTLLLVSITLSTSLQAQRQCGTMEVLELQLESDPKRGHYLKEIEQHSKAAQSLVQRSSDDIITIPVVFHVVYRTGVSNVSDDQLLSQLEILNADFRRLNADTDDSWPQAADSKIEFCLASVDPHGNPTNGITRTATSVSIFNTNDQVKNSSRGGVSPWPTDQYLNIWVCRLNGVLGYAQLPGGNPLTDGVVCDYRYIGNIGTATAPFDLGRTVTHEVGHWLNLRHIWGEVGCSDDDLVADTPLSDGPNYGCTTGHTSCGSLDMVSNYMDYSDDACMNTFTAGQKNRMRVLFTEGGARSSLLHSYGCGIRTPDDTCADGIHNEDEIGIDCGGPKCTSCATECEGTLVEMRILLDDYPRETSWQIHDESSVLVASDGNYGHLPRRATVSESLCLPSGCYTLSVLDSYGDGICCKYGAGSFSLESSEKILASGGDFGRSSTTTFCLDVVAVDEEEEATCEDGILNGDETAVDCGGLDCPSCPEEGIALWGHSFETGLDGWIDGGTDCARLLSTSLSYEGIYCIRLRDNTGVSSSMTSPKVDLSPYNGLTLSFVLYGYSMEYDENVIVQLYNGQDWQVVADLAAGSDFDNEIYYQVNIPIDGNNYQLSDEAQLRIMCDASGNNDHIYIDQVTLISGSVAGITVEALQARQMDDHLVDLEVSVYPNPAQGVTQVSCSHDIEDIQVVDVSGATCMMSSSIDGKQATLNISNLASGLYFMRIVSEDNYQVVKLIRR